jgi:hypothetical protein
MKKLALLFCSTLGFIALSAFTPKADVNTKLFKSPIAFQQQGQQQTVYAWRMAGGQWQQGSVSYLVTQYGIKPISYDFSGYTNGRSGRFMPDDRFMPLNPNNELAKKNNWTHSINSMAGTLYLSIY